MECLHWNLVAPTILGLIGGILKGNVVLHGAPRESCLLRLARTKG
jgi:hypothetical protein